MKALVPVDVVALTVPYLRALMPGCTVSGRVQSRSRMVHVSQAGGSRRDHVLDDSLVVIQCYDTDSERASRDCREAFTHLLNLPGTEAGANVRDVEGVGLPGRADDRTSGDPMFQASVQINLRPGGPL